ncbi:MAG: hypothetical protein S4CHLAM2_06680 [Chlamydiales bacterium]|nr:hypothetical protein [Chlamydiales bacterium]
MALIPYTGQHQLDPGSFRQRDSVGEGTTARDVAQSILETACVALACCTAVYTCQPFRGCLRLQSPLIKQVQKIYSCVASLLFTLWLVSAHHSNKHLIIPRLKFACGFGPQVALALRTFTPLDTSSPSKVVEKVGLIGALVVCVLQVVYLYGTAFGKGGPFQRGNLNDRIFVSLAVLPWPFIVGVALFQELNQGIDLPAANFLCGFGPSFSPK